MNCACLLSMLSLTVLSLWVEPCCRAIILDSIVLHQASGGQGHGRASKPEPQMRRTKRSWVWNQFFVLEEFTGDEPLYIGKLHSDMDQGDGQVRYILGGDGASSIFTVNEDTGDVHAARRLDREQQASYVLRAQARDRVTDQLVEPESQFIIKVQDINDNAPRFLDGPYVAHVAERSPAGSSVATVTATDADDPAYGNSARLVYSILQGQPYFSVDTKTGVVRTALPDLDREARDQYLVVIQAKDMMGQMGGLSGTTSITVTLTDVNDNPPVFPRKSYQFTVLESVLVLSVVAKVKAVDLDLGPNAEVDYKIMDGDGLGTFRISTDPDSQEGLITLHKPLDFETKSSYYLHIEASNQQVDTRFLLGGAFRDTTTVRLLVENVDEPPVFSPSISWMVVSEAAPVGTNVGSVSAHDPDVSRSPVRYSIDRNSDIEHYFDIDSISGTIRTTKPLDREISVLHNITVVATESLDWTQAGQAAVLISVKDVNDNAPSFAINYQMFVCEEAQPGQIIETLSAVDPDEPVDGHHFVFSLPAEAAWNHTFTLRDNHDNTASVLTGPTASLRPLHLLPVVISDGGSPVLSSTSTLTISVCPCDVHGHRCSPPLLPHAASATAVLTGLLALLGVAMVTVIIRSRRMEPRLTYDERDIRENVVRYDDEGGGERDTEAFDMFTLTHLNQIKPVRAAEPADFITGTNQFFWEFIRDRLLEADLDPAAPPFDSLQTYAFEGDGTLAESLSSLDSADSSESGQNYDFLRGWGSKFSKLADLYGHHEGGGPA